MQFYINSLVLKVASRCNLNCTYCYMYNKGDLSYLTQPKFMSVETMDAVIKRAASHSAQHDLKRFNFIFHGGEPLLAGIERLDYFVYQTRNVFSSLNTEARFTIQTNGMLLNDDWCRFIGENNIGLGISLDGPKEINDINRVDHSGKGSYDEVVQGFNTVLNSPYINHAPAMLSVVNPEYEPAELLNHFLALGSRSIDFLLPDNNYVVKPTKPLSGRFSGSDTPYGDWVIELYKLWKNLDNEQRPAIRTFQDIMWKFLGGTIDCDVLGNDFNRALVIETDGGVEAVDSLKICGDSFTKENASILQCEIDEAITQPLARMYFESHKQLCDTCEQCEIRDLCGGGFIAHRYSKENQFNNPSVYCKDYCKFFSFIQNDLLDDLPVEFVEKTKLERLNYHELIKDQTCIS
jgi:uncharacterized protein